MILCLRGRLQTRLFLAGAIGLPVALVAATLRRPGGGPVPDIWRSTAAVVALMAVLGLAWELVYHGLQQLRVDRDWPSVFTLAALAVELGPLWLVARSFPTGLAPKGGFAAFTLVVAIAWLAMWAFAQGPMRVVFLRWRLTGGQLLWQR